MNSETQHENGTRGVAAGLETLLAITLAHHLIRWWAYPGLEARLLGILAIAIVANDWLTSRSAHDFLGADILAIDLMAIFILNGVPHALAGARNPPDVTMYWGLLAACEGVYLCWDLVILRRTQDGARSSLKKWIGASSCAVLLYSGAAVARSISTSNVGSLIGAMYALGMLIAWNAARLKRNAEAGKRFLD